MTQSKKNITPTKTPDVKSPPAISEKIDEITSLPVDEIPQEILRQQRPDGRNPAEYRGYKKWSKKRWAWEFLRRNERFRTECGKWDDLSGAKKLKKGIQIALEFSLKHFKHCDEPYAKKGRKINPAFNKISVWSEVDEGAVRLPPIRLRKGQVIIRFNISAALLSKTALEAQIRDAKVVLEEKALALANTRNIEKLTSRRSSGRDPNADLISLRLLDAKLSGTMSDTKTYAMLFPDVPEVKTSHLKGVNIKLREKYNTKYETAKNLSDVGYITIATAP